MATLCPLPSAWVTAFVVGHEGEHVSGLGVDRGHPGPVHDREVVSVGGVFKLDLPVAVEPEFVLALDLDGEPGALLHEPVDPHLRVAEEFLEGFDVRLEAGEDQPVVALHPQLLQGQVLLSMTPS